MAEPEWMTNPDTGEIYQPTPDQLIHHLHQREALLSGKLEQALHVLTVIALTDYPGDPWPSEHAAAAVHTIAPGSFRANTITDAGITPNPKPYDDTTP